MKTDLEVTKIFNEITINDTYLVRNLQPSDIDTIIDIGANIGIFSLFGKFLFPRSRIIAIEPEKQNFQNLLSNVDWLENVFCDRVAYGDGSELFLHKYENAGTHIFKQTPPTDTTDAYSINSMSLVQIFEKYKIDRSQKYLLKIDCEGGEKYLLSGMDNEIIRECTQLSMEIHFRGGNKKWSESFEQYRDWVDQFKNTHSIIYHHSSRRYGNGVFVLKKL